MAPLATAIDSQTNHSRLLTLPAKDKGTFLLGRKGDISTLG
jgi:hypothetical protein